ncbi:NADP-binding protein [Gigaspora margarita]|uniref:enoyl-[acyl-carrier-protein] reductase n=1 Tax=Gigaspora margarita TaxID=4874 RepID=A0A8H3X5G3_GIGMA|nr:NADP-binding protein [Gigaspora margarita]
MLDPLKMFVQKLIIKRFSLLQNTLKKRWLTSYIPPKVKAITFNKHGPPTEVLRAVTYQLPPLTPTSLHLKFLASPINPSDINQIEGVYPIKPNFKTLGEHEKIAVAGNEGVAQIIGVGDKVEDLKVGDWVVMGKSAFGTWRTHAEATPDDVIRIPHEGIGIVKAATLTVNPCSAYRMLKDFAALKEGDFVIQNGANSGVGQAVIQIAKAWNINTINIIRDRPNFQELKDYLKSIGATYVISDKDLQAKNHEFEWNKDIVGKGIALGLNCVSGKGVISMAKLLRHSSPLVTYGAMSRQPLTIPASLLIFTNLKFFGFWMARWGNENPRSKRIEMLNDIIELIKQDKLRDVVCEENIWGVNDKDDDDVLTRNFLEIFKKAVEEFRGKKQLIKMI